MTTPETPGPEGCSRCGEPLVVLTEDFAGTPDETTGADLPRAELQPGQMVQTLICTTPGCEGPDDGARV